MKKIKLTQNKYALVDDEDFEKLSKYKWHFTGQYAAHRLHRNGGNKKIQWMHRFILNTPIGKDTDHINGNKLDNRKKNLRICSRTENSRNSKIRSNNTSGFKGVHWHGALKKWRARIKVNGKCIHLGCFDDKKSAHNAYCKASEILFGEFANKG